MPVKAVGQWGWSNFKDNANCFDELKEITIRLA